MADIIIEPGDALVFKTSTGHKFKIQTIATHLVITSTVPSTQAPQLFCEKVGITVNRQHVVISTKVTGQPGAPISGLTLDAIPGAAKLKTDGGGVIVEDVEP